MEPAREGPDRGWVLVTAGANPLQLLIDDAATGGEEGCAVGVREASPAGSDFEEVVLEAGCREEASGEGPEVEAVGACPKMGNTLDGEQVSDTLTGGKDLRSL
eukprot:evm.model.scf_29.5 EVM.evm.TU.scf_29.5   scf_29:104065-106426(-)